MSALSQLALNRVKGQLPVFAGATLREQLINARAQARAVLLKYAPDMKFDGAAARDVMSNVNAWVERNRADLEKAMQSSEQTLPRFLVMNMGSSERVQQWVIANYTIAAQGLGPWDAGMVDRLVIDPSSEVSKNWAMDDAQTRLNVFAMLIKMDNSGELAYIFQGPGDEQQRLAFGIALPVWAIVVIVIGFAAVITYLYLESRKIDVNNALMRDLCEKAQDACYAGNDKACEESKKCIEAMRDLQLASPWQPIAAQAAKVAIVLGGGYLLVKYVLPKLMSDGAPKMASNR